jgi:hypothetical protein
MTAYAGKGYPRNRNVSFYECLHRFSRWQDALAIHPLPQLKGLALRKGGISTRLFFCRSGDCAEKKHETQDHCVQSNTLISMPVFSWFSDHVFLTFRTSFDIDIDEYPK